jgi:hypothetical protein
MWTPRAHSRFSKEQAHSRHSKEQAHSRHSKEQPTAGTQKSKPTAGIEKSKPTAGIEKSKPTAGTQKSKPTAGTQKSKPAVLLLAKWRTYCWQTTTTPEADHHTSKQQRLKVGCSAQTCHQPCTCYSWSSITDAWWWQLAPNRHGHLVVTVGSEPLRTPGGDNWLRFIGVMAS